LKTGEYRQGLQSQWLQRPTLLELRAVAAALAHPPLLAKENLKKKRLAGQGPRLKRIEALLGGE
jgi:hypothetical protein